MIAPFASFFSAKTPTGSHAYFGNVNSGIGFESTGALNAIYSNNQYTRWTGAAANSLVINTVYQVGSASGELKYRRNGSLIAPNDPYTSWTRTEDLSFLFLHKSNTLHSDYFGYIHFNTDRSSEMAAIETYINNKLNFY